MKQKNSFLLGVLFSGLFAVVFSVGRASATTGCFTDSIGSWAESAICWMKDNGITNGTTPTTYSPEANVTRAEMAVFMQRSVEIPPSTGDIYINQALTALQPNGNFISTARVSNYDDYTLLNSTTAGVNYFLLSVTAPSSLYGRGMFLKGVQVCYDASPFRGATLTSVDLKHFAFSAGASVLLRQAADSTARTDAVCRSYLISSPAQIQGSDHISLNLSASFPSSFDSVYVSSISAILTPSNLVGGLSPIPGQESVPDPALHSDPATSAGGSNR